MVKKEIIILCVFNVSVASKKICLSKILQILSGLKEI